MVYCPECETDLDIDEDEVDEGAVVSCPECGTDFEVITVNPVELKKVGEDEDEEGRSDNERLTEGGIAEAEIEQSLQATRAAAEKDL